MMECERLIEAAHRRDTATEGHGDPVMRGGSDAATWGDVYPLCATMSPNLRVTASSPERVAKIGGLCHRCYLYNCAVFVTFCENANRSFTAKKIM
jgi:hypothetical protein